MKLLKISDPLKNTNDEENNINKEIVLGIDLGTTNSVAAAFKGGKIQIIDNNETRLIPSIVAVLNNEVVVGDKALKLLHDSNSNTSATVFRSIKRIMGKNYNEAQVDASRLNLNIEENSNNKLVNLSIAKVSNSNIKSLTPEQISGFILKYLKEKAEEFLNTTINKAVITVPAYFGENARVATKNAAKLAGLKVLRLINEPTAAALAYGLDDGISGTYLIYDLGGGTFDVSLLKLNKGVFRVIATKGNLALGGDDFDFLIAQALVKQIEENYKIIIDTISNKILLQAKAIKEQLSKKDEVVTVMYINSQAYEVQFTKEDLKKAIMPLLNKTIKICKETLKEVDIIPKDLNGIVLVGGSTRIPLLHSLIKNNFKLEPYCALNPDEVVAIGAAYQAANLNGDIKKSLLLDITPLSLGIETYGGVMEKIIFRNTPIPVAKSQEFTTFKDNQTSLTLHVLQGERELVKDNQSLDKFVLKGIPSLPAGVARVEVNFTIDTDGLLVVTAKEKTSNISQSIEVKPSFGLEVNDIKNMVLDSIANAESDMEQRLLENSKIEALHLINITKHALKEDKSLISKAEVLRIEKAIQELEEAIKEGNKDKIKKLQEELKEASENLAAKRMNKAIKQGLEGKSIDSFNNTN